MRSPRSWGWGTSAGEGLEKPDGQGERPHRRLITKRKREMRREAAGNNDCKNGENLL